MYSIIVTWLIDYRNWKCSWTIRTSIWPWKLKKTGDLFFPDIGIDTRPSGCLGHKVARNPPVHAFTKILFYTTTLWTRTIECKVKALYDHESFQQEVVFPKATFSENECSLRQVCHVLYPPKRVVWPQEKLSFHTVEWRSTTSSEFWPDTSHVLASCLGRSSVSSTPWRTIWDSRHWACAVIHVWGQVCIR